MDKVCFSHIENYVSVHKIVVRESSDEFQVVEVKVCEDCGKTWHSLTIYSGRPTETCPDCKIAAQDKFQAESKKGISKAQAKSQQWDAYDQHEQPYD